MHNWNLTKRRKKKKKATRWETRKKVYFSFLDVEILMCRVACHEKKSIMIFHKSHSKYFISCLLLYGRYLFQNKLNYVLESFILRIKCDFY